jgi:hypothetical protein
VTFPPFCCNLAGRNPAYGVAANGQSIYVRYRYTRVKIAQVTLGLLLMTGIASHVDAATASWDRNPEPDIAGYLLSYGTEPGEHTSTIDVGNVTTFDFDPEPGRYYFVVRAYNTGGYLSEKSAEATIDIPAPTPDLAPDPVPDPVPDPTPAPAPMPPLLLFARQNLLLFQFPSAAIEIPVATPAARPPVPD